jgi:serine/threonine-protein kinase
MKQPSARYQAMTEVKTALEQVTGEMESRTASEPHSSIAVLPFVNMSGDKEQEYFSDGLAEEIINALAKISGLKVPARTSSFHFRGKEADIHEISTRLGVKNILEGSVRKSGSRIRVTAQLISCADGYHLWSERYDREITDVFAIQDEICQAIVDKLRVEIAGGRPVKRHTENVEAYNLYLKGHYHLHKYTQEGFAISKEYFEQAITADPQYALAWFGLAETHWYLGFLGFIPPKTANANAGRAAIRALELDDRLPEVHAMMAILRFSEFDWRGTEDEFRRALELGPKSPFVWWTYSLFYLIPMRRLEEAVVAARKAMELDPLSPLSHWQLGHRYLYAKQYDRACEHFRNALELDPRYSQAHLMLGICLVITGKVDEGVQACETGLRLGGRFPANLALVGCAYLLADRIDEGRKILEELQGLAAKTYVYPMAVAYFHILLGEMDKAFNLLEKAIDEHDGMIINAIAAHFFFDPLRSHPRYHALLRKMNLEP